jgi:hypothetical protein
MENVLKPRGTSGSLVTRTEDGWRLEILAGNRSNYRLAQLDDYVVLSRRSFHHAPPWTISLLAKVSATDIPGTWGFGLWNDPFGFSLGFGRTEGRLPVLPNAAWFFHASPPNWLSLRDGIPACGFFAGSINTPPIPSILLAPALLSLPLLVIKPVSRLLRKLAARVVRQDAVEISTDATQYHEYSISWLHDKCLFNIDGNPLLETPVSPHPPLGLVFWIDNQFASWDPKGNLAYGTLDNPASNLEVKSIEINR